MGREHLIFFYLKVKTVKSYLSKNKIYRTEKLVIYLSSCFKHTQKQAYLQCEYSNNVSITVLVAVFKCRLQLCKY